MSYWNKTGKHEADYHKLYDALVPECGNADTLEGELLRASSRLYYRYYNDGDMIQETSEEYLKGSTALYAFGFLYHQTETYRIVKDLPKMFTTAQYESKLEEIADFVVEYILSKNGNYHKANLDMLHKEWVEGLPIDFYEEEEEYEEEY